MPIIRDVPITLTPEQIIVGSKDRPVRASLLRDAEQAIALGQTLWQPQAVYDWFEVRAVEGEQVILSSSAGTESALQVGPKADLLAPARRALASVATIGPALEEKVHELQAAGESLASYMLECAGVVALGSVGEALRRLVEGAAAERGWGVSPSLSPGSLAGWSLRDQRALCALLPLEQIGVHLNGHSVLEPHKSASGLIGLGPGYETTRVGSVCKYCALNKTCWRRREDPV